MRAASPAPGRLLAEGERAAAHVLPSAPFVGALDRVTDPRSSRAKRSPGTGGAGASYGCAVSSAARTEGSIRASLRRRSAAHVRARRMVGLSVVDRHWPFGGSKVGAVPVTVFGHRLIAATGSGPGRCWTCGEPHRGHGARPSKPRQRLEGSRAVERRSSSPAAECQTTETTRRYRGEDTGNQDSRGRWPPTRRHSCERGVSNRTSSIAWSVSSAAGSIIRRTRGRPGALL